MSSKVITADVQVPSSATAPIVADFTEHALRIAYVNRRDVKTLPEADWSTPGCYVLLSDDGSRKVYVGKTDDIRKRLTQHNSKERLPWRRAVAIQRDTSHGFNTAEIGYLEGRLTSEIAAIPGMVVVADRKDQDTTLPPHQMLSLDALLPSMLAALRLAGIDIHRDDEGTTPGTSRSHRKIRIEGTIADLLAAGLLRAGVELVANRKGATVKASVTTTGDLLVDGVAHPSPSKAAQVALKLKAANGWDEWRIGNQHGPTLASLRAKLAASEAA